jgi:carbon-monoxide dehydrogenase large subunit
MDAKTTEHAAHHHPRVEDDPLVRGLGRYADDVVQPGQAHAYFQRSPHAFARIVSLDASAAKAMPGVLAVLTDSEMQAAGITNITRTAPMPGRDGSKLVIPDRPALAHEYVRHVGEAVACVVAVDLRTAQDAAEAINIEYEELPALIEVQDAQNADAPQLHAQAARNVALDWPGPCPEENIGPAEAAFAKAAHVARVKVVHQRMVMATMEPRGATGLYDAQTDSYTLRACSQGAGPMREGVRQIMNLPKEKLRVLTDDVGGAFGLKSGPYPEYPVLLVAAKTVGRPVHWMSTRSEAFLSDNQCRDNVSEAELAMDAKGKFLALRVRHLASMGAYLTPAGANIMTNNVVRCFPGMYDIPIVDYQAKLVFTNTVPTGPYRGAGRPEANYVLERLVDEAARVTGIDKVKLRRRNLVPNKKIPYKTAVGTTYDSGDFETVFDKALELNRYGEFKQRRKESKAQGKLRGIGFCCFLEHSGGMPTESALLAFPGGQQLTLGLGVHSTGQGHASVFGRIVAERLGIPMEQIQHRHGDSGLDLSGFPSVGSRSAMTAGAAIVRSVDVMLAKGKSVAAQILEASESDIEYRDGAFGVVGTDRRLSLFDVASRAKELAKAGKIAEPLDTKSTVDTPLAFPNGVHIAEVEIDPTTGVTRVVSYTAVDDCGNVLDHMIIEGQMHGAVAQGVGQVLLENAHYDTGSGQLVTGSFMDYAMPRADHVPPIKDMAHIVPATTNPLGVKGVGEAGTIASLAAVMNAIADAVPNGAADHMDMPATAEKVWRALQSAGAAA